MKRGKATWGMMGMALALGLAFTSARGEALRLGSDMVPLSQVVELDLDPSQATYAGRVQVETEVLKPTQGFRFHAEAMDLRDVRLTGPNGAIEVTWKNLNDGVVGVTSADELPIGNYEVAIDFVDDFNTNAVGLYRMEAGRGFLFTQFEADDAREAFPCWDEPAFKIPFQLILTVPVDETPVTNTPVVEEKIVGGMKRVTFAPTPPIPTYLIAIAVGDFEYVPMDGLGVPGGIYAVSGQGHLAATAVVETPRILRALEAYFDRPYPYAKLDFIAVPEFWPGAMEHPGAVTYADQVLLADPEQLTISSRRTMVRIIAHELAHQWFGNLVTMEWWDDLWLNESFADWIADKITHQLYPNLAADVNSEKDGQRVMIEDARATTYAIQKPVTDTNGLLQGIGIAYNKGKAVLRMFEGWVGEEEFRQGVIDYLEANAWGNATSNDLWAALARRSSSKLPEAMATFVEQPGFPLIDFEFQSDGGLRLTQRRFRSEGSEVAEQLWQVPLTVEYPTAEGVRSKSVLFEAEIMEIDLGLDAPPTWIVPKAEARGYYRWLLPESIHRTLVARAEEVLTPSERIDLLGNSLALLQAGTITGPVYLETLAGFANDPDAHVLDVIPEQLGAVRDALVRPEDEVAFAQWVRQLLRPAAERFGIEPQPEEPEAVTLLRPDWIRWLGRDGRDPGVRAWAERSFDRYLEDSGSVDPSLVSPILSIHLADADPEVFEQMVARFEAASTPVDRSRYLRSLGLFGDPTIRRRALDYSLRGPVRSTELYRVVRGVQSDEAGRDQVFDWMMSEWDEITQRIPGVFLPMMPSLAGGCSRARMDRARDFFTDPARTIPGADLTLAQTGEEVEECARLYDRESEAVGAYLRKSFRPTTTTGDRGDASGH